MCFFHFWTDDLDIFSRSILTTDICLKSMRRRRMETLKMNNTKIK